MLGSIPHQKLCFYHLPTRGQEGIKLGDADTSPMILYYHSWMFYNHFMETLYHGYLDFYFFKAIV